jgi:hypothetical protein
MLSLGNRLYNLHVSTGGTWGLNKTVGWAWDIKLRLVGWYWSRWNINFCVLIIPSAIGEWRLTVLLKQ